MDVEGVLAIIMLFGGGTVIVLGFSPVGRAFADRIRGKHGSADVDELRAELTEQRDTLTEELQHVRQEVAELAERLDFAERLLAQRREAQRLGPGRDG